MEDLTEQIVSRLEKLPENFAASEFAITVGPREVVLILGQTRHLMDSQTGQHNKQVKDWHASYSLSPVTAKQLHTALSHVLEMYEKQFGALPIDPSAKIEFVPNAPV